MEDHIPTFPSWVQMAMNSSNSIGRPQTELELATTMATFFQNGMDLKEAITQAKQGDIKCQQSLPAVAHYVQRFAGGPNFPLIHFLGKFGKLFGGTLLLGGDFFHALAHTDFKVSGQVFLMVRMGLWATMLTNPQKSQDGFAKVFTKADIEKLRSHQSIEKTKQAETMLAKAWETYQELVTKNSQMELHYTKCFGKFTVRLLLFLTQKQKVSKEAKSWDSMEDILKAFTEEVQNPPASSSTGPGECSRALPHVYSTTCLPAWPQEALIAMPSLKNTSNVGKTPEVGMPTIFTNCLRRRKWKIQECQKIHLHSSRMFRHFPHSEALHVHHHPASRPVCGSSECVFGHVRSHRPMPWWCAMESHHKAILVECCGKKPMHHFWLLGQKKP